MPGHTTNRAEMREAEMMDRANRKDVRRVLVADEALFFHECGDSAVLQKTCGGISPRVIADDVHFAGRLAAR